ncbi:hypothetical protein CL652_01970 [bacterium]|nr:hypothetical protein [bacterium]|tara:strand:- start:6248 stop:6502 length:255 start_codon:yes stop_codon:yes gene_type:complete
MDVYTSTSVAQANSVWGNLGPSVWTAIFFAIAVFFAVYSAILIFHWFSFSMRSRRAIMATVLYLGVSSVFIFSMLASIITLTTL